MTKTPQILIAASIYPPEAGGPALHAKMQYEGFPKLGLRTGLVALTHFRRWPFGVRHILYFISLITKVSKYDLVYAHDALGAGIPAMVTARLFKKKFMVRIGGDVAWEREAEGGKTNYSMNEWYKEGLQHKSLIFKCSRWLLKRADKVVVPAEILKNLYVGYYNIPIDKIVVIPNPVSRPERLETKTGNSIIFASRLVAYKNLSFVLKVFAEVAPQYPETKLMVMGDGPELTRLKKLAETLKLEGRVVFSGTVSQTEVAQKIAESSFAIAPALTEFNPNYVLQTISLGKPFLISKENGLNFNVPEEFIFDPKNEVELESKICSILDKENYKKALEKVAQLPKQLSNTENLEANKAQILALLNG